MKLMNLIIETLNDEAEERGEGRPWEAMHCEPVEIVETPSGIRYKDVKTGKFKAE